MRESDPSEARDPRGGLTPEGVAWLPLRPASWTNDQSSTSGCTDLLEADEHGQVGSEVRKIPEHKSQGSSNYNTNNNGNNSLIDLSDEQIAVIKQAEARLTPQQREQILRRVSIQVPARVAQNTERTPSGKGKSIDPGNWGAANLNEDDINLDVQKQIYESTAKA
ncbi:hypothetical protein GYMLUDRAFT_63419 [Collybiopsis luxurians FD-317 M1]|uniref:Unplaced genomic scaffold GYMLUscaffold_72, whole genome shotgun sequence n=1 Tax=Collybiopsis luxurians FD-317 M1 TaxID=944289 RepID=A0A0D0C860_9AGAR|nr:hypothetical protein GYMLUDRAFT_63419 [Collybiopsis luxurians FD-317 M1]